MLVSLREVGKYVDLSGLTAEEIAARLTNSGIEVEEIKRLSSATNLVVGEVVECENHPDSDHLHVTKVNVGDEILDIVCGAPNCRKGLKVIVARAGAKLPGGEIKKGIIRGCESNGMLCALNELGVDPKYLREEQIKGIEELPSDFKIGSTNVLELLGLDDTILDLSLLANRADCYSLFNVARELGALFNRKVNIPSPTFDSNYEEKGFNVGSETDLCKEFACKVVKGVEIKDSPDWLKNALRSEGIRSINNIVDLGNYIMLLTGQPLHMYDYDKLPKKELIAKDNIECNYVALDEKTYGILKGDIVITSDSQPMCIGGIMGGLNSEVTADTKNIVIEAANFNFAAIRKTSNRLGLVSDSSQRFVKGLNKDQADYVLHLTTNVLKELSKIDSISQVIKYDTFDHSIKEIDCSLDYINNRLGTSYTLDKVLEILELLNFKVLSKDDNNFRVSVPSYRIDVEGKADLSEEIIRYIGFDTIESHLPDMETTVGGKKLLEQKQDVISDFLVNSGLYKVLTYSLVSKEESEMFNVINNGEHVSLLHPLTVEHAVVRNNLTKSLLNCVSYNLNHQNKNFGIFEISNVYTKVGEESHLGVVLSGLKYKQDRIVGESYSYYDVKGIFDTILGMFNISSSRIKLTRLADSKEFHPTRSALASLDNKPFCVIGEIYPTLKEKFDLGKDACVILEMNLSLLDATKTQNNKFSMISNFPSSSRDYAFVISKEYSYSDIRKELKKCSPLIKDVRLFDIYSGANILPGYVSLAVTITFESMDHTLKEIELVEADEKIWSTLKSKFNVVLR